jgi:hypothetical protein
MQNDDVKYYTTRPMTGSFGAGTVDETCNQRTTTTTRRPYDHRIPKRKTARRPTIRQTKTGTTTHLPRTRRTAKYQVGHVPVHGDRAQSDEGVVVTDDVVEVAGSVLLYPRHLVPTRALSPAGGGGGGGGGGGSIRLAFGPGGRHGLLVCCTWRR